MVLSLGAIFVRLTVLQVGQAGELQTRALDQRLHSFRLPAERGRILDRSRAPLALSIEARDIYADPRYVTDPWATATRIGPVLGLDVRDLANRLSADSSFAYVARQVGLDPARRVEAMNLPGIGFLPVSKRYYPAGPLAPQILGFVGVDGTGLAGLEYEHQLLLAGTPGERTQELDPNGQPIAAGVDLERDPVPGSTVVTTIDRALQFQVQQALAQAVAANRARGGTVIVLDPRTGEILAMATYPWFDPNDFAAARPATYRNRAVTDAFEPGSTNKVITAAAALEEGVIDPSERLPVPSHVRLGQFTIHDAEAHPFERLTLGDIVAVSSNVGIVRTAERLGPRRLAEYMSRFGLGRETGIGFPGESSGVMLPPSEWGKTVMATASYGAGLAATPLQMASAYATIANGGRRVQPRLVDGTIDPDGMFLRAPAGPSDRVVSATTARTVGEMLAYAVQAGTGVNAQIPGFQVAGKTGTARIPRPDGPGYEEGQYMASFIGFLPASAPRVVIAAILDRPATDYGGVAAAPLFRSVARSAIQRLGIEPSPPLPLPPHALPLP